MPPPHSASVASAGPDGRRIQGRCGESGEGAGAGPPAESENPPIGKGIADELRGRWTRFWLQREARKREQLIAAGRAAIEKYTPSARRDAKPGMACDGMVSPPHREPAIRLRADRDR